METLIVTKVTNPKETNFVFRLNKKFGKVRILRGKEVEHFNLVKMLDEAMMSENIPLKKFRKELLK